MPSTIRVAITTPLPPELRHLLTDVDARVELLVDDELLPPMRYPGDHDGDPAFRRTPEQQAAFEELLGKADVFYGIPDVDPATLVPAVSANPRLRWVHTMAAGGGAQIKAAGLSPEQFRQVVFTTSAGVHANTLAEFALFGILSGAKDLARLQAQQRDRQWTGRWAMKQVHEQVVLIVGLGGIGARTAQLAKALGATVLGTKRTPGPVDFIDEVVPVDRLPVALGRADAVVFTLPATAATDKLYDAEMIAATKPGAVIVNVGRGTVIDEPALIDALNSGHLASAFLDVFQAEPLPANSPLWDMPQVIIAPHTAALSPLEDRRIAELFAQNLRRFLDGDSLLNVVDTVHFY